MRKFILRLFFISRPFPHTQKLTPPRLTNIKKLICLYAFVLSFILLLLEPAFAGGPPIQWQKTFGGSDDDGAHSVQQTTDRGYIIAGTTWSFDTEDPNMYLIKADPNGNSQWQKTFGGSDGEIGYSVRETSDGGFIIAGVKGMFPTPGDVYLVKTDPNGNYMWQKTFGGNDDDRAYSVQQTSDDGYIIIGSTESFGAGSTDVYLIKTDPNGDSQWQKTFGGSERDQGRSVQQTTDGGYIIAGDTDSYGAGVHDVYLIKTDPNGDKKWQKTFGGSDWDRGYSVQQTTDGGYIIAGDTQSYGTGGCDVYLIKTDPNGNSQWQKTFGGSDGEIGYSVRQTSDGGFIIAGVKGMHPTPGDVYLVKTDPNGNRLWQKIYGEYHYHDTAFSAQQTSDSGFIIAGCTRSSSSESLDVYLIKLCPDGTLSADFNCNGTVYYEDLEILTDQWLQFPGILSADIFPELGDGKLNGFDFATFAHDWLQSTGP